MGKSTIRPCEEFILQIMETNPQTFRPQSLSICMIVKNEERLLARCLESCRGVADEIVINDTGSTDATIEIARSHGARVIVSEWKNDF